MDELEQAKKELKEIKNFFLNHSRAGNLKNVGYNDGISEEYKFENLSMVISYDLSIKTKIESFTFYEGSNQIAQMSSKGESQETENIEDALIISNAYSDVKII